QFEVVEPLLDGAAAGAAAGLDAAGVGAAAGASAPLEDAPPAPSEAGAWLPPRKSVTYQPEPLSWKPAAVSCFWKEEAPQAGQTVSRSSDIRCNTSLAWPQEAHL